MTKELLESCSYLVRNNKWGYSEDTTLNFIDNNLMLLDCCGLSFKKGDNREGVYMIGDFYIGKSINIRKRILQHFQQSINSRHYNKDLAAKIVNLLLIGEKIPVKILSHDTDDEEFFIKHYREKGYYLFNKEPYRNPKKVNLKFKIDVEFKEEFKKQALSHNLTLEDYLTLIFNSFKTESNYE